MPSGAATRQKILKAPRAGISRCATSRTLATTRNTVTLAKNCGNLRHKSRHLCTHRFSATDSIIKSQRNGEGVDGIKEFLWLTNACPLGAILIADSAKISCAL